MRKTPVLYAVHIGRLIKKKWALNRKLKIESSNVEKVLEKNNIKVYNFEDICPPPPKVPSRINLLVPEDVPMDENHPDWKEQPCYIYGDNDVLLEGLEQARVLTNTVEIRQLPSSLRDWESKIDVPCHIHEEAKRKIMQSLIFDASQNKLPKRKDPARPAWVFTRDYGITEKRKNQLLLQNMIQLCEQYLDTSDKVILTDAIFSYPMKAFNKLIKFELTAEVIVRSKMHLLPPKEIEEVEKNPVPNLWPVNCTISIKPYHFYDEEGIYPIAGSKWPNIHTVLFSFNRSRVKNIFEEEVLETQCIGRNLLKGFTAAAAQARALYGGDVKKLTEPIVVQLVMTDGKFFHFSVFQLNNLDPENDSHDKNIYWNPPLIPLYDKCEYLNAKPTLESYNPEVLNRLMAFYMNQ